jgi:large subunit ribosomal protein L4
MKIDYFDWSLQSCGQVELADDVFGITPHKHIVAAVVRWQMAKARSGNHETKTRSEVSGTNRKPHAQKETGKARQGSLRSPQFRGGGVVFGPHKRSYEYSLNKKVRALGLKSALSDKITSNNFVIFKDLSFPFKKTNAFIEWLNKYGYKKILFVSDSEINSLCFRNVQYCDAIRVEGLNVLDILKHTTVICDLQSLQFIHARFKKPEMAS